MNSYSLINRVFRFVADNQLIEGNDKIVIAVSGGADSVALTHILCELREQFGYKLFLCHLNHKIRGEEAEADEQYCRELAKRLNLEIYCEHYDVPKIAREKNESLELAARNIRYEFYLRACKHFSVSKIALAHHKDDLCETIIFNIIRGCSFHGLRGIPVKRALYSGIDENKQTRKNANQLTIIRPIMCCEKSELETFLQNENINWRIDRTNYELKASRNVIRHKILPEMEKLNSAVREHLSELANQSADIEAIIEERAENVFAAVKQKKNEIRIEQWRLATLPELIACEIVRKMISALGAGLRQFTFQHYINIAKLTGAIDLPEQLRAMREGNWLVIYRSEKELETIKSVPYCLKITKELFVREKFATFCRTKTRFEEMIDADKIKGTLEIRFAREGEKFYPLGMSGQKKIGDFLTDVKAGKSARPAVVVADEQSVIWVVGWRIDERVKITDTTKNVLILTAEDTDKSE